MIDGRKVHKKHKKKGSRHVAFSQSISGLYNFTPSALVYIYCRLTPQEFLRCLRKPLKHCFSDMASFNHGKCVKAHYSNPHKCGSLLVVSGYVHQTVTQI